jgi:hypothetical protein
MDFILIGGPHDRETVSTLPDGYIVINTGEHRSFASYAPVAAKIERTGGNVAMRELLAANAHLDEVLTSRGLDAGTVETFDPADAELVGALSRVQEANRQHSAWLDRFTLD